MSDDFEENDLDLENSSFDEFEPQGSTLGSTLKNNPLAKIALIVGAIVVVFSAVIMFGGKEAPLDQSYLGNAPDISAPPGTQAASPEYIDAIQEVNERNVEIARAQQGSALPTPIEPPVGVLTVPEQDKDAEDPLQRWRRLQEERLQRELQQAQTIEPTVLPDNTARQEAVQKMAEAMSSQMQAVLENKSNKISYRFFSELPKNENVDGNGNDGNAEISGNGLEEEIIQEVLLPAGEIAYAQLLIEANTDAPGPILAEIMSGPLKGARLIGSFEKQRDYLTLNFNKIVIDDMVLEINAIALDPDTTLPGLVSEIDHRYFSRALLPAAAAFITGFTEAIAQSGATTVTIQGETVTEETADASSDQEVATGVNVAGEKIAGFIDNEASSIKTMIRVAPGTPMGVLFVESVVTDDKAI